MMKRIMLMAGMLCVMLLLTGCKELPAEEGDDAAAPTQALEEGGNAASPTGIEEEELLPEEGAVLKFRSGDKEFAEAVAVRFYELYGVEVTTEEGGLYDFNKGVLEGATGQGPDVFMSPHDKTLEGIQAGLFLELEQQIVDELNSQVSEVAMKTVTVDGKVYGVPVSVETNIMFYNKELVTGEPAATFEQLKEEALSFNDPRENKYWYLSDVCEGSPIYPMLSTYGFDLFGPDGTDDDNPGFDTPEFELGLGVLADYRSVMPVSSGDLDNDDFRNNQFIEGKTAYIMGGPWNVKTFREEGVDFGVTSLVTYDGHPQRPFAFVQNAHISAYTSYPRAAQLLAQFLVSAEGAELLYTKASKVTSRSDVSEVNGLKEDEILIEISKAFSKSIPMPSAKRISYYWTISASIGPAVFDEKMTPKEGAEKAMDDWNALLQTE